MVRTILPDKLTYPGTAAGLLLSFWSPFTTPVGSLLGVAVGAGSLLLLIGLWYLVRRQMGMGLGDPKMLATIGSFLGVGGVVVTLFASSILGSVVGVALNPDTPLDGLEAVLDRVGLVLVMSVFPGFGGQSFMPEVLPKVEWLRARGYTGGPAAVYRHDLSDGRRAASGGCAVRFGWRHGEPDLGRAGFN